jgi:isopentenyldiphosphate isomerase
MQMTVEVQEVDHLLLTEQIRVQSQNNKDEIYDVQSDSEKDLIKEFRSLPCKFVPYRIHATVISLDTCAT